MKNIKILSSRLFLIAIVLSLFISTSAKAQLLKVDGQKIVNSTTNDEVVIHAMNTGNWMVMEGYMMNSADQAPDQHTWKKKLTTLIGAEKTKAFYDKWLKNYVAQADIKQIKAWGFNAVRLPIHYEYFVNEGAPDVWNDQGFLILDDIISWCEQEGIYAIIDLHAAPGGQSDGAISDYDNTKPSFWDSAANQTKAVELWRKISERYKDEPWVGGYDLINEPAWAIPGGIALRDVYVRMTNAIRENADNHIIFIEGNWYANDFAGLTPAWDTNMVYSFHKYWSTNLENDVKWMTDFRAAQNRPIWCGEHGENSNDHFTKTAELFKANNIGTAWWPMKKFGSLNDFADAKFPSGYNDLLNYFAGLNPSLNPTTANNTLTQLVENVKLQNCKLQTEVIRAITTQVGNRNTAAFAANTIPGKIYASNYDYGMNGYAYSDQAWEDLHVSTGVYTSWNNGWTYRNGGVDIELSGDVESNGYSVGWFNAGEWMKYTVDVQQPGTYTVAFRVASGSGTTGKIQIQNADGTKIIATSEVTSTGGWKSWLTYKATAVFKNSGVQAIRIANLAGEFNINSVNFVYENANTPDLLPVIKMANIISLKGNNGKYVTFSGTNSLVSSTATNANTNEKFTVIDLGDGTSALMGGNGLYVTLNPNTQKLNCNSSTIGTNQKFVLENLMGIYAIKAANDLYVSSENGSAFGMTASRTSPGAWEYFNYGIVGTVEVLNSRSFENKTNLFGLYPNPAQNSIAVSSPLNEDLSVVIYDINGREIINKKVRSNQSEIDVSHLNLGVYMMKISGVTATETLKFIKK